MSRIVSAVLSVTAAVALYALLAMPASAATAVCYGTGLNFMTLTTPGPDAATCGPTGNGNKLGGANDPIVQQGYTLLDTTNTAGDVTLDVNGLFNWHGSFSFDPTGYQSFILGFQTATGVPRPDWYTFVLPDSVTSGSWSSLLFVLFILPGDDLHLATLYGLDAVAAPAATPLPAAFFLFGSVLVGGAGMRRWQRKARAA